MMIKKLTGFIDVTDATWLPNPRDLILNILSINREQFRFLISGYNGVLRTTKIENNNRIQITVSRNLLLKELFFFSSARNKQTHDSQAPQNRVEVSRALNHLINN